jgi:hypothetical protein
MQNPPQTSGGKHGKSDRDTCRHGWRFFEQGISCLRRFAGRTVWPIVQRHLKNLRQVQSFAIRLLRNLFPATEAVGNDQTVPRGIPDSG